MADDNLMAAKSVKSLELHYDPVFNESFYNPLINLCAFSSDETRHVLQNRTILQDNKNSNLAVVIVSENQVN